MVEPSSHFFTSARLRLHYVCWGKPGSKRTVEAYAQYRSCIGIGKGFTRFFSHGVDAHTLGVDTHLIGRKEIGCETQDSRSGDTFFLPVKMQVKGRVQQVDGSPGAAPVHRKGIRGGSWFCRRPPAGHDQGIELPEFNRLGGLVTNRRTRATGKQEEQGQRHSPTGQ